MYFIAERNGRITVENSFQDRFLKWMYTHRTGRILLRPLVTPKVSEFGGWVLNSGISKVAIRPFIKKHGIDMSEYEKKKYSSYNDFFQRKLSSGARRVEEGADIFVSPCDSRAAVYKISEKSMFVIKHTAYTVESLLRSRRLAEKYTGGYVWVFRLCVEDYHRYIYVDHGQESKRRRINGVFHTVNPTANDHVPIYKENTREYSLLKTENFGTVLQMEVGALLVGKIENGPGEGKVQRGQEKGKFAFGGSTVILMTQAGTVQPDGDILKNSAYGIETRVRLGEHVGKKCQVKIEK